MIVQDHTSSTSASLITTITLGHTCGTLIDGALFAVFVSNGLNQATNVTATYAGVSMTKIGEYYGVNEETIAAFYLVKPASGANNIVFSWSGSTYVTVAAVSYAGVHQAVPVLTGSLTNNSTLSVSVPSVPGDVVLDVMFVSDGATPAAGAGQTELLKLAITGSRGFGCASTEPGATGSVTMSWTGGGVDKVHLGFSIHYAATCLASMISPFMYL